MERNLNVAAAEITADLKAQTLRLVRSGLAQYRADPLAGFRFKAEGQRHFVRWAVSGIETLARSSNSAGKTTPAAALGVALARGLRELDGEPLPALPIPNVGWVLTQSYKQQLDSSQAAYKRWIGTWPHYVSYVVGKGKGYWESVYIATDLCRDKHTEGSDPTCSDCPTCSRISFHCEESKSSVGGRIDWAHADEPPKESSWREIRSRRDGDKMFLKFISATPLELERFQFMQDDFSDCMVYESPFLNGIGNCEDPTTYQPGLAKYGEPRNNRAEVRWTLYDNESLSDDTVAAFIADWRGDPFIKARIRGDYVNTAGRCPFDVATLQERWLPRCIPGKKRQWIVQEEVTIADADGEGYGREIREVAVESEEWFEPEAHEKYVCVLDPSAGIKPLPNDPKSKHHDPAGILVVSRVRPRVVARYNGYLSPYGLGSLAAQMARRHGDALIDVDMTGGYGAPCYSALHAAKYRRLMSEISPDKPGMQNRPLGFRVSSATRGRYIGDVQQAIIEDSILCLSREVVICLLGVTVDETGATESARARKNRFDEDMSCLARCLALLQIVSRKPKKQNPIKDAFKKALGMTPAGPSPVRERW